MTSMASTELLLRTSTGIRDDCEITIIYHSGTVEFHYPRLFSVVRQVTIHVVRIVLIIVCIACRSLLYLYRSAWMSLVGYTMSI